MSLHHIYIGSSTIWKHTETNKPLIKIGSSNDVIARFKNFKTSNPYPVILKGYYKIHNYNCYKLDNIIKSQMKQYRMTDLGGGTEFYEEFDSAILDKLFHNLGIEFEWCDGVDISLLNSQPEALMNDLQEQITYIEKSSDYLDKYKADFAKINIMLFTVGKNINVYNNYIKSIRNGISGIDPEIYETNNEKERVWGIRDETNYNRMQVGDYVFFVVSSIADDQYVDVLKIRDKIDSTALSVAIWKDKEYSNIFILDRVGVTKINKVDFLRGLGYSEKWTMQGCPIMDKSKQVENMDVLSGYLMYY